jgi:hypothetical protein
MQADGRILPSRDGRLGVNAIRLGAIVAAVLLATGCTDVVKSHYRTRAEAEADRLFGRGWLPDIIPASSRDITTRNDLDINHSTGGFSFAPEDSAAFLGQLQKVDWSEVDAGDAGKFRKAGYSAYSFRDADSEWTFFVDQAKGRCRYRMGLTR